MILPSIEKMEKMVLENSDTQYLADRTLSHLRNVIRGVGKIHLVLDTKEKLSPGAVCEIKFAMMYLASTVQLLEMLFRKLFTEKEDA